MKCHEHMGIFGDRMGTNWTFFVVIS